MAVDTYGTKNEPQFATGSPPDTAADLTTLGAYAAKVGNRKAGTSAQRTALTGSDVWPGLEFYETDTGLEWVYLPAGSWTATGKVQSAIFTRTSSNASDTFASGSFVTLIAGAISGAPKGAWLIGVNLQLLGSTQSTGNLRMIVNSSGISLDKRTDLMPFVRDVVHTIPYQHNGGDMALSVAFNLVTGTGTSFKNGTNMWAQFIGPVS